MKKALEQKDAQNIQERQISDEYRMKLQNTFKEYTWMDQNMVILRREAQKGSEAADSRNIMLQKSLEKLTADFEICSKELAKYQTSSRELEFELETLVRQFNGLGDAKKKLDERHSEVVSRLKSTEIDLRTLVTNHEQLQLQKSKIEAGILWIYAQYFFYVKILKFY